MFVFAKQTFDRHPCS